VLVYAATVAMFGLRVLLSLGLHGPFIVADEVGYLANARVIAGGVPINLSGTTFYDGGYSLLIAPAFWLSHDPTTVYRVVLIVGAAFSALVLPLVYAVLRDLGQGRRMALAAALVATVAPDVVFPTAYAMSEVLMTPLVVAWIWCTVRAARPEIPLRARAAWAASSGVCVALLYATHVRGTILAILGLVALAAVGRVAGWQTTLAGVVAGGAGLIGATRLNDWLRNVSWPNGAATVGVNNDLLSGHGLARTVGITAGQLWYAAVASACLVPLGAMWAFADAGRTSGPARARRAMAASLALGAIVGIALGVAVVAQDPPTANWFVYGRYVAIAMPLPIAWGVICLLDRTLGLRRWVFIAASVALVPVLYGIVTIYAGRRIDRPNAYAIAVPSIVAMARPFTHAPTLVLKIGIASVVAIVVFGVAVIAAAARWRGWAVAVLTTAAIVCLAGASTVISHADDRAAFPDGLTGAGIDAVRTATHLGWDARAGSIMWRLRYAYYVAYGNVEVFDGANGQPPADADVVVSTPAWDGRAFGYRLLTQTPGWSGAVWVRSS
jgi:hypothetical protein